MNGMQGIAGCAIFILSAICAAPAWAGDAAAVPAPPSEPTPPQPQKPAPKISSSGEDIPDWKARWELARVLCYAKQYAESAVEYQKLLTDKSDLPDAKAEYAAVLFWQGKKAEALALADGLQLEKLTSESRLLLADLYAANKNYDKAEKLYRARLAEQADDVATRVKLADMLSWSKRYDESLAEYQAALKAVPGDVQVRRKHAFVLIWAGRNEEGAAELRKTLEPNKGDAGGTASPAQKAGK